METFIAPFAQYGLGGLVIGWLFYERWYDKKIVRNGMMTVIKDNTTAIKEQAVSNVELGGIIGSMKESQDRTTVVLERLERLHDRN